MEGASDLNNMKTRGAVILAGGDSKRMGRPKPLLELGGVTLIERMVNRLRPSFEEITIVADQRELFDGLPVRLIGDLLAGPSKSPLRGIHAGLSASDLPYQFCVACDMPFINMPLVEYMAGFAGDYDVVVPRVGDYYQPLHGFYNRSCLELIRLQVEQEQLKTTAFYDRLKVRYIGLSEITRFDPDQESFFNINTWADYEEALRKVSKGRFF
jgi:molybdenum cofactor guanylyltransferase